MRAIRSPPLPVSAAPRRPKSNARVRRRRLCRRRPPPAQLCHPVSLACLSNGVAARRRAVRLRVEAGHRTGRRRDPSQRAWLCPGAHRLVALPQATAPRHHPRAAAGRRDHSLADPPRDGAALPAPLARLLSPRLAGEDPGGHYSATTRSLPLRFAVRRFSSARLKKENALSSSGR